MNRLATVTWTMTPPRPPHRPSGFRPMPWGPVRPATRRRTRRQRTYPGKVAFDTVLAATMLLFSVPILGVAAVLVRLTSHGPVIYTQPRLGRRGRIFVMYKIRTMRHDCERFTGPTWATPNDPRV